MDFKNGYEKIALSKHDYTHVFNNMLLSAMDKLNLHLPAPQNDPLKNEVSSILEEFLVNSFDSSKYSILADGRDLDTTSIQDILLLRTQENVEQIDPEITSKLRGVLQEFEQETVEVTKMRREVPIRATEVYANLIRRADNEVSDIINQIDKQEGDDVEDVFEKDEKDEIDYKACGSTFHDHLRLMEETQKFLPGTRTTFERCNRFVQFLEDVYQEQQRELLQGD